MVKRPPIISAGDEPPNHEDDVLFRAWEDFNGRFGTEQALFEELYKCINEAEGGIRCRECGNGQVTRQHGSRVFHCLRCKRKNWLTAGTFFHRIRSPRPWLAAIWFMEHGIDLSAHRFHRLVGIAYAAAAAIFKKVRVVLASLMPETSTTLPSSSFVAVFLRRSRETPARQHPAAEEAEADSVRRNHAARANDASPVQHSESDAAVQLSPTERALYEALSHGPAGFDYLCQRTGISAGDLTASLVMLQLEGLVASLPGDRYCGTAPAQPAGAGERHPAIQMGLSTAERAAVDRITKFLRRTYSGISRKYLQHYLAAYWRHVERSRWGPNSLIAECLKFGPISSKEIMKYVTPASVRVLPEPA